MSVTNLAIEQIIIPKGRRVPTEGRIASIARSIEDVGLLHPVVVNEEYRLIAGHTRLLAAKKLDWAEVPITILKADAIHAELAEIVENIERSNLSALEEAEALKRMKEIYLALHPETKHGGDRKSNAQKEISSDHNDHLKNFADDTASKTGKSSVTVRRSISVAEKLTDATKTQITGTKVEDNKAELKRLADLPQKQQEKVAKVIGSGKAKTVAEAKKVAGVEKPKQGEQKRDPRVWSEIEKNLGHALNKVNDLHRMYPNRPMHGTLMMQIKQAMKTLRGWKESIK